MEGLKIFSLEGKTAIVTGAGRGLGKTCALALAGAGATVVCVSRTLDALTRTADEIRAMGGKALPLEVDVLSEDSINSATRKVLELFGRIDILVNNAGVVKAAPVERLDTADWDWIMDTNLKGAFLFCKSVVPHMKKQNYGKIVNMSSLGGIRAAKNLSCYTASKAGLMRFSETLALEVIAHNITVNCICPGYVASDMNKEFFKSEAGKRELARYPMKRPADADEIAGALIFLASDASSYVTASTIIVDGAQRWKGVL